uniref:Uncharacterized protein n=1 Tax=Panagrolaimus sp. PS1159 TaxID=55785 RepID=A0AC35GUQ2_9BILA
MADGKRPFLKKGAGLARLRQRSVALNPPRSPAAAAETSSSENSQSSKQSLPLIENLSPITKEPASNIRPTTAETGDSAVRDINVQISPSNHSGSIRNTGTAYNQEPPPKAAAELSSNYSEVCDRTLPPPAAAAAEISSSENAQTSTQSLPLKENLSTKAKKYALIFRPTTAETGDSGVRNIIPQIPSSSDSGSVRSTVTNRKSPAKAAAETNVNESEGENLVQQYLQINSTSARLIENHGPELTSGSSSRTNSYTSLDRIQTPPGGDRTKENESPELSSNMSEKIYASSRSKGSTSVGTSAANDASNETENNDSVQVVHDSSGVNKPSRLDSSSQFNGIFNSNNNHSLPPPTQYQHHDDTPLNSKRHDPLCKSSSSSSLLYGHLRKPQSYIRQTARRFGIVSPPKYVLPPRPKPLESPDFVNGLGTPQASSTENNIFCHTPMLSENFVKNEDGKIVQSLAEQLRAVLVCIDVGMDERKLRVKRVTRALQRKEQEMKERMAAEENKLIGGKAKLKLEFDKMKRTDETVKNLQNELKEVKTKHFDTSRKLSDNRTAKNQIEQKLKKTEEELKEAREKAMKWESLNGRLKNELDFERMKKQSLAKRAQPHVFAPSQQQP